MDYDKMGIVITMVIMVGILGFAGVSSGELGSLGIDIDLSTDQKRINPTSSTNTNNDAYYQYCYRMGYEC